LSFPFLFPDPEPRILLVDDDRHARLFLTARLAFLGAKVKQAADGVEGLAALEADPPHLILSDAVMPRLDGFEFCRQVKQHPAYGAIPFALITSVTQSLRERALQAGADDYLAKSESDLVFRIRTRYLLALGLRGLPQGPALPIPPAVLVVSRSRAVQTQLFTHLSKDGIEVTGISTTAEVQEQLRTRGADALIIDLEQGPDQLEVLLGNLASQPEFASLPILALASKAEAPHLAALELQITDVLAKPLDGPETRHRAGLLMKFARG